MNKNSWFDEVVIQFKFYGPFFVDSEFEGEIKQRINFGQP